MVLKKMGKMDILICIIAVIIYIFVVSVMAKIIFNIGGECSEETIEKILLTKNIKKIIVQDNEKEIVYEKRDEGGKMNKAETIAYAIAKECRRMSLVNWCKEWDFTVEDFYRFLDSGKKYFEDAKVGTIKLNRMLLRHGTGGQTMIQIDCPINETECDENCVYYNKLLLKCPMKEKGNGGKQDDTD